VHIPDGFVSGTINSATFATSIAVCSVALKKSASTLGEKEIPLIGVTSAFVFSAQMINFPVAAGTSGHFLGALLSAIILGPLNGALVIALVVTTQALLFADGGITALGTNFFNMAIIGGIVPYYLFVSVKSIFPKTKKAFLLSAGLSAWISVVLASAFAALELSFSGTFPLMISLTAMTAVHSLIGIGEALITYIVLSSLLASRPDIVKSYSSEFSIEANPIAISKKKVVLFALALSLFIAIFVSPFASKLPDGLERVLLDNHIGAKK